MISSVELLHAGPVWTEHGPPGQRTGLCRHGLRPQHGEDELREALQPLLPLRKRRQGRWSFISKEDEDKKWYKFLGRNKIQLKKMSSLEHSFLKFFFICINLEWVFNVNIFAAMLYKDL